MTEIYADDFNGAAGPLTISSSGFHYAPGSGVLSGSGEADGLWLDIPVAGLSDGYMELVMRIDATALAAGPGTVSFQLQCGDAYIVVVLSGATTHTYQVAGWGAVDLGSMPTAMTLRMEMASGVASFYIDSVLAGVASVGTSPISYLTMVTTSDGAPFAYMGADSASAGGTQTGAAYYYDQFDGTGVLADHTSNSGHVYPGGIGALVDGELGHDGGNSAQFTRTFVLPSGHAEFEIAMNFRVVEFGQTRLLVGLKGATDEAYLGLGYTIES